ncbi:MAG: hypothetical protein AAFN30_11600, partial [Actinomycetota bacterium]
MEAAVSRRLAPLYQFLDRRPGLAVAAVGLVTAVLLVPFLTMAPETSASTEPDGDVFTARDRIDETFVSSVHPTLLIIEAESGDLLQAVPLLALWEAEQELRADPELGPNLVSYFDAESGTEVDGVLTLADLVDAELRAGGVAGIGAATDAEVRQVGTAIIDDLGERASVLGLSARASRGSDGWTVPALTTVVLSDNAVLGFGNTSVALGGDTDVEEYDRALQEVRFTSMATPLVWRTSTRK